APKFSGQLSRSGDQGLFAAFDLKKRLIEVKKTRQAGHASIKPYCDLLETLRDKKKAEQYQYFKKNVVPGMSPLFSEKESDANKLAMKVLKDLYAELVEYVLATVRERRGLTAEDLVKLLQEINKPSDAESSSK